jgi:hypothetical protein
MSQHHQCARCSRRMVSLTFFLGTLVALLWSTHQADAAWQTGQITVGEGKGGSTTYSAQKQKIRDPEYKYVMPFGLAELDNGQIILAATEETDKTHKTVVSFSSDGGDTWSPFNEILPVNSRPTVLTYLGGGNLSVLSGAYFSSDYGKTWSIQKPINQHYTANEGNAAVVSRCQRQSHSGNRNWL